MSDGVKVNAGSDPLGFNAAGDGIPDSLHVDPTIPSWAPAIEVSSTDYTTSMQFTFRDLVVPLSGVRAQAEFNATQQTSDLSTTYVDGATWTVNPGQYGNLPDVIDLTWQDVYGTHGTIKHYMSATSSYKPKAIAWQATDAQTQKLNTAHGAIAAAGAGDFVVGQPGVAATIASAVGAALDWLVGKVIFATAPAVVAIEAVGGGLTYLMLDGTQELQATNQFGTISYTGAMEQTLAYGGLSVADITNAMNNAQEHYVNPGGIERWIWDDGVGFFVVIITIGSGDNPKALQDAWKWDKNPVNPGTMDRVIAQQLKLMQALYGATATALANEYMRQNAKKPSCNDAGFASLTTIDGADGITSIENAIPVPDCLVTTLHAAYDPISSVDDYKHYKTLFDNTATSWMFDTFYAGAARVGALNGKALWFWDEGASAPVVCPSTGTTPDKNVRRCDDHGVVGDWGSLPVLTHQISNMTTGAVVRDSKNDDEFGKELKIKGDWMLYTAGIPGPGSFSSVLRGYNLRTHESFQTPAPQNNELALDAADWDGNRMAISVLTSMHSFQTQQYDIYWTTFPPAPVQGG